MLCNIYDRKVTKAFFALSFNEKTNENTLQREEIENVNVFIKTIVIVIFCSILYMYIV